MHKSHHVVISSELPCIFPFSTSSRPIQPNLYKRFKSEEDVPKLEPVKHCSELWTVTSLSSEQKTNKHITARDQPDNRSPNHLVLRYPTVLPEFWTVWLQLQFLIKTKKKKKKKVIFDPSDEGRDWKHYIK